MAKATKSACRISRQALFVLSETCCLDRAVRFVLSAACCQAQRPSAPSVRLAMLLAFQQLDQRLELQAVVARRCDGGKRCGRGPNGRALGSGREHRGSGLCRGSRRRRRVPQPSPLAPEDPRLRTWPHPSRRGWLPRPPSGRTARGKLRCGRRGPSDKSGPHNLCESMRTKQSGVHMLL